MGKFIVVIVVFAFLYYIGKEVHGLYLKSEAVSKLDKFMTEPKTTIVKDASTGESVSKVIPVIAYGEDGLAKHWPSGLVTYGVSVIGDVRLNDPGFEDKTLDQIAEKRKASMGIITAKANAELAKQATITAKEEGIAKVMKARYEKEVIKEQAVVDASRLKEVAVIKASQQVAVAEQKKLEAEQMKLAAVETKEEQILLGQGESERKRMNMEADGALGVKVAAWKEATIAGYKYLGQRKWASEITMINGSGGAEGNSSGDRLTQFMDILTTKTLKDLSLDMSMKGTGRQVSVATN